jgi:hypothetical protein
MASLRKERRLKRDPTEILSVGSEIIRLTFV